LPGNALLSVYDKTGLDRLVWIFSKLQVKMLGSGGTAEAVRKLGFNVVEVSEYTKVSEMPGGLVKTLHPKIHGGILGDWKIVNSHIPISGLTGTWQWSNGGLPRKWLTLKAR